MDKLTIDLPENVKEAVLSLVSSSLQATAQDIKQQLRSSPYLNKTEASKYLHISSATLIKWEKKFNDLPTIEIEGIKRYRKEDLDKFMEQHKIN